MPDSLDIAKQRKLVEDLRRDGQNTDDAETRLRLMLDFLMAVRGAPASAGGKLALKSRQHRSDMSDG